jgi:hypothetical protein
MDSAEVVASMAAASMGEASMAAQAGTADGMAAMAVGTEVTEDMAATTADGLRPSATMPGGTQFPAIRTDLTV